MKVIYTREEVEAGVIGGLSATCTTRNPNWFNNILTDDPNKHARASAVRSMLAKRKPPVEIKHNQSMRDEVLRMSVLGMSRMEIASRLNISTRSVDRIRARERANG